MVTKHTLLKAIIVVQKHERGASFKSLSAVRKPSWVTGVWVSKGNHPLGQRHFGVLPCLEAWREILTLSELSYVWESPFALQRKQAEFLSPIWLSGGTVMSRLLVKGCPPRPQMASSFCFPGVCQEEKMRGRSEAGKISQG